MKALGFYPEGQTSSCSQFHFGLTIPLPHLVLKAVQVTLYGAERWQDIIFTRSTSYWIHWIFRMTNNVTIFFNIFTFEVLLISKSFLETLNLQHLRNSTMKEGNSQNRNTRAQTVFEMKNITRSLIFKGGHKFLASRISSESLVLQEIHLPPQEEQKEELNLKGAICVHIRLTLMIQSQCWGV